MITLLDATLVGAATSSAGVRRVHLGAAINGEAVLLAEIDVMSVDWDGVDDEGEQITYWDPPKADEPYLTGYALSLLMYHGSAPAGRSTRDAEPYRAFPTLWDAILGVATWYGWDLMVHDSTGLIEP